MSNGREPPPATNAPPEVKAAWAEAQGRDPETGHFLTKMDEAAKERAIKAASLGAIFDIVAAAAGVSERALKDWIARDPAFAQALDDARNGSGRKGNAANNWGGYPTKQTPETERKILDALQMGATDQLAAAYGGVATPDTVRRWRRNDPDFNQRCVEAEARGAVKSLMTIHREADKGTWTAAAWLLERRYPHMYGMINRVELNQTGETKVTVTTPAMERAEAELKEWREEQRAKLTEQLSLQNAEQIPSTSSIPMDGSTTRRPLLEAPEE